MAAPKKVTVVLGDKAEKKNVVRFNCDDDDAVMTTAYISKAALAALGNPDKIKITVEAA
jgi:hypothetical protein